MGPPTDARLEAERDAERFVACQTRPQSPELLPELTLALVDELTPLWENTETHLATLGLPPPFWAFAWAGGQALARHVLDEPTTVAGRRVLDFAAGSGLVGLAAARAGAAHVLCADTDPFATAAVRHNAALNGLLVATTTDDLIGRTDLDVDVVLAGDICYEDGVARRVLVWLRELAGEGRTVLLGDPGRTYAPTTGLVELAAHDVATSREIENHDVRRARVWRLLP